MEYLYNGHRGQQKEHYLCSAANVFEKDILGDILLDDTACGNGATQEVEIIIRVLTHHEVGAVADVQYPTHRSCKYSNSSLIDFCQELRGN